MKRKYLGIDAMPTDNLFFIIVLWCSTNFIFFSAFALARPHATLLHIRKKTVENSVFASNPSVQSYFALRSENYENWECVCVWRVV